MKNFDIYFFGQIADGQDPEQVRVAVAEKFKISGAKIDALFSGKPMLIKSNVDVNKAGKYRDAFRQAGALIDIVATGEKPHAPQLQVAPKPVENIEPTPKDPLQLEPEAIVESPIDQEATNILDTSSLSLAPISPIPEQVAAAVPDIPTSDIQLAEAKTGTLEGFALEKPAVPIPDISQFGMSFPGENDLSIDTPQRPAEEIPDIAHLQAAPANSGSLEDCKQQKAPLKIPDISNLKLVD